MLGVHSAPISPLCSMMLSKHLNFWACKNVYLLWYRYRHMYTYGSSQIIHLKVIAQYLGIYWARKQLEMNWFDALVSFCFAARDSLVAQMVKGICLQCRRPGFDPWVGKISWRRHGNPLQYSCLENPMDRGAWRATSPWGCKEPDLTSQINNNKLYLLSQSVSVYNGIGLQMGCFVGQGNCCLFISIFNLTELRRKGRERYKIPRGSTRMCFFSAFSHSILFSKVLFWTC